MSNQRMYQILKSPLLTEKSARGADKHAQHVFKVANDATKTEIKNAVETLFNVKVRSVKTMLVKGKNKRFGQILGKRNDTKKAIVCLAEGHDINFAE